MVYPTLLLNCTLVTSAKFYLSKQSALYVAMCAAMSETQDGLQRREERDRLIKGHKKHQKKRERDQVWSLAYNVHKPFTVAMISFTVAKF